jgi:hypothetical protein
MQQALLSWGFQTQRGLPDSSRCTTRCTSMPAPERIDRSFGSGDVVGERFGTRTGSLGGGGSQGERRGQLRADAVVDEREALGPFGWPARPASSSTANASQVAAESTAPIRAATGAVMTPRSNPPTAMRPKYDNAPARPTIVCAR